MNKLPTELRFNAALKIYLIRLLTLLGIIIINYAILGLVFLLLQQVTAGIIVFTVICLSLFFLIKRYKSKRSIVTALEKQIKRGKECIESLNMLKDDLNIIIEEEKLFVARINQKFVANELGSDSFQRFKSLLADRELKIKEDENTIHNIVLYIKDVKEKIHSLEADLDILNRLSSRDQKEHIARMDRIAIELYDDLYSDKDESHSIGETLSKINNSK